MYSLMVGKIKKLPCCLILAAILLTIMITGCAESDNAPEVGETYDQPVREASVMASDDTLSYEAEEDIDQDTFELLTEAEIEEITEYIRRIDVYGFLCSEYDKSEDVSLSDAFFMGAGLQEQANAEEVAAYLKANGQDEIYTNCVKLDADKVKDLLTRRLDCDIEALDLSEIGIYLPEYDAFFREEADVNYVDFTCDSGVKNSAGGVDVIIHAGESNVYGISELRTILLKKGDDFLFISNEKIGSSDDSETSNTYDEAYLDEHAEEMWDILYKEKFSTYEPIEMRHGLGAIFSVVLRTGAESFDENTKEMTYENIVSLEDCDEDGRFQFKWHKDYYDNEEFFGEKTLGWYWVDGQTGEVTAAP